MAQYAAGYGIAFGLLAFSRDHHHPDVRGRRCSCRFSRPCRQTGIPVSLREYLAFLEGMAAGLATYDVEGFYYLARTAMVKDERHLDRFDRAFAASFQGLEKITAEAVLEALDLPAEWLEKLAEKHLQRRGKGRDRRLWAGSSS